MTVRETINPLFILNPGNWKLSDSDIEGLQIFVTSFTRDVELTRRIRRKIEIFSSLT